MPEVSNEIKPKTKPASEPVEFPLSSLRQRQRRRGGRVFGGGRTGRVMGWAALGFVGVVIIGLIASPLVYRSLRPEYRERIKHYVPFMASFDPQRAYTANTLPTVAPANGDSGSAVALLLTPDMIAAAPTQDLSGLPTPSADGLIIITATPMPQPTALPTELPTATPETVQVIEQLATEVPTLAPSATWTPLPPPTEIPVMEVALLPSARLYGFDHIYQTWNNCGPATLTMGMSYYGWKEDQSVAAAFLKPDAEDKNVSPWQMVRFVNENSGIRALTRVGGDLDVIRRLVLAGFPVIVETGYTPEGYDWMGHYRLVVAYDDRAGELYAYDSFLGHGNFQGLATSYQYFDENWQHFNRTYIVLYEEAREGELSALLGENADLSANFQHALEVARQEAAANPSNPFAWFNMGSSYVGLEQYEEAARAFDQARNAGTGLPWRMLWYQFGPFKAYYEVGRYDDVLALVQTNLGTTTYVEETYYWTGMVYMAQGKYAPARGQFNLSLQHNRNYFPARDALAELDVAETQASTS